MNEMSSLTLAISDCTLLCTVGSVPAFTQITAGFEQAVPARVSDAFGDSVYATPNSVLRLNRRRLRGIRLPNPIRNDGATLLNPSLAVPLTGLAALLV